MRSFDDRRLLAAALEACRERRAGAPLFPDPVAFPHRYSDVRDVEAAAFVAASFAFGAAAQITRFLDRLFGLLGPSPHAALTAGDVVPSPRFADLRYRFVSPAGVRRFLACLRTAYAAHGTLENMFRQGMGGARGIREPLAAFLGRFRAAWGGRLPRERDFLFPDPLRGSAAKRHNLFLRWVVRGPDGVDLGIWRAVSPADLVVPLDTHMARMASWLGLTDRRTADWRTAEAITEAFRAVRPEDPVRYDFALTRGGILGECTGLRRGVCEECPLARLCRKRRE